MNEMSAYSSRSGLPLVGRSTALRSMLDCLIREETGLLVVAEAGLGKSAVAKALASSLHPGSRYIILPASRSLQSVPFGALAPLLDSLAVEDSRSPIAVVRTVIRSLKQLPGKKTSIPIVIVDDAHVLDESSAAILGQIVSAGAGQLVALSRPVPGPPDEIVALWREGLLRRIDLAPLRRDEVHELCRAVLGPHVLLSASVVLEMASAGNPMFLLALIEQGQRMHHLVNRNGTWMLSGEPPAADQVLTDVVETELMRLSKQQRKVLETVALAEPLPLPLLRQLAQTSDIDTLDKEGIITVGSPPERLVRPGHPLYGEIVRQRIPLARSIALRQSVVGLIGRRPASLEALLRCVSWSLDCGASVEDRQLLRAAMVANRLYQTSFAMRAASAITEPGNHLAARVEMARAHYIRSEFTAAEELLSGVIDSSNSIRTIISAALLSAQLRIRRGASPRELRVDSEAWSAATERIAGDHDPENPRRAVELSRIGSRLLWLYASNLEGPHQYAEPELRRIEQHPQGNADTKLVALTLLGELFSTTGRPNAGAQAISTAMAIVVGDEDRLLNYYEFVVSRYIISLIDGGRWDEVTDLLTEYLEQSPQTLAYFGATVNLATGTVLIRQGLALSALGQLSPAIEALRETDPQQLLPLTLGLGAYAASLVGQHSMARGYIEHFFGLSARGSRQLWLMGRAHIAASRIVMEGLRSGRNELRRVALDAADSGIASVQLVALELSVRLDDRTALRPLLEVASNSDSAAARLLSRFATATLAKDPEELRRISAEAADARYFLICADCLSVAVRILQARGKGQRSRQFQAVLAERVSRLEGIEIYPLDDVGPAPALTRRERDIAILVLESRSNREIAGTLGLSVRTVEGHLYRIFAKLGISHRSQLTIHHLGIDGGEDE